MDDTESIATLIESTTSKIQQLQQAFSALENSGNCFLNLKWKQLEEHFHGLENSLKHKFDKLVEEEKEYALSLSNSQQLLATQEAQVLAKELTSLERLQEKRDAVLFETFGMSKISFSSSAAYCAEKGLLDSTAEEKSEILSVQDENTEYVSELVVLCRKMDVDGIQKYISENRKNLTAIREEMPAALKAAPEPPVLVLDSLRDFYSEESVAFHGKKSGNLLGVRRTCLMLMEVLCQLRSDAQQLLSPAVKDRAKQIASEWKWKIEESPEDDYGNGNSLDVHAFLQLLGTFDITAEFDEDELYKLIPCVSRRRQLPELCRLLGLSAKMPGVIELLIRTGRQIEAINLAFIFGLTDQFAPMPLLKSYLKDVKKASNAKNRSETNEREMAALKSVIKCVEEHKLEDLYPVDPLQKRVAQLEQAKADKRQAVEASKPQSKRPRATTSVQRAAPAPSGDRSFYHAAPAAKERSFYQPTTPPRHPYTYDRHLVYAPEAHHPAPPPAPFLGSPYATPPPHAPYYGAGYPVGPVQYQIPYIH